MQTSASGTDRPVVAITSPNTSHHQPTTPTSATRPSPTAPIASQRAALVMPDAEGGEDGFAQTHQISVVAAAGIGLADVEFGDDARRPI